MDDTKTFDGEIAASGVIRVENKTTGKYTLVGCIYDAEGAMQGYTFISFGYIAKGDAKPVILTMGLEATNEFAGQGITPDNSAKFYAFGEEIESATYGLSAPTGSATQTRTPCWMLRVRTLPPSSSRRSMPDISARCSRD